MKTYFKKLFLLSVCFLIIYLCKATPAKHCAKNNQENVKHLSDEGFKEMELHTTPSGLTYRIVKEGQGKEAKKGSTVSVHYTGWLDDHGQKGKEFDSSFKRNQPFSFPLGKGYVIQGWDEGVQGMKEGEVRLLYIPSHLGYGVRGAGASIPPYAALIFEVELIKA